MKVCDKHIDRKAVDSLHLKQDDAHIDLCDECKYAVMAFLTGETESLEPEKKKTLVQKVFGKS